MEDHILDRRANVLYGRRALRHARKRRGAAFQQILRRGSQW